MLSDSQIDRYSRQIILPEISGRGQEALLHSAVLVIGGNHLAEMAAGYLAAAGVGRLTAAPECIAALNERNPDCHLTAHQWSAMAPEANAMVHSHDVVIDAAGSAASSRALNMLCLHAQRPLLWARGSASIGRLTMFAGHHAGQPCYACMVSSSATGAITPLLTALTAQFLGCLAALEAIKAILGIGLPLSGRMLLYHPLQSTVDEAPIARNPGCPMCGSAAGVTARLHE